MYAYYWDFDHCQDPAVTIYMIFHFFLASFDLVQAQKLCVWNDFDFFVPSIWWLLCRRFVEFLTYVATNRLIHFDELVHLIGSWRIHFRFSSACDKQLHFIYRHYIIITHNRSQIKEKNTRNFSTKCSTTKKNWPQMNFKPFSHCLKC